MSKFVRKTSRTTFVASERFVCVNRRWTKKKDIYFYNRNNGVSRGDFAVRKREESVWLVAAKLAENRGEFTSVHTALSTMRNIIKALRDERYWSVSRQDTNGKWNHYTANALARSMDAWKWRYRKFLDNVLAILLENLCKRGCIMQTCEMRERKISQFTWRVFSKYFNYIWANIIFI